jgi:hypothetical protein
VGVLIIKKYFLHTQLLITISNCWTFIKKEKSPKKLGLINVVRNCKGNFSFFIFSWSCSLFILIQLVWDGGRMAVESCGMAEEESVDWNGPEEVVG